VVYDGRYAWAAVFRNRTVPWLLVIDPENEKVWQVSEQSGLPIQKEENMPQDTLQQIVDAALREKAEYEKVVAAASDVIRQNPRDAKAFNRRALAYHRGREWEKAVAGCTEAMRIDPQFAAACNTRGVSRLQLGDPNRAIEDFTEAIRLDPKFVHAYNNRGVARFGKGDLDGAAADFTDAIRIDPTYAEAYYDRGAVYRKKGELDRAIADYTEAIRIRPTYGEAYTGRAGAYERKGDFQRGCLDRAENMYLAAFAYAEKGDLDSAEACLKGAIDYNPKHAKAFHQRGLIQAKKGNAAAAAEDFAAAARLDPKYTAKSPGSAAATPEAQPSTGATSDPSHPEAPPPHR